MLIALVYCHVKPDRLDAFKAAAIENAGHSINEPGVVRFDVIQQQEDPTRFVLVEVYRDADAQASHKQSPHYFKWLDTVPDLLVEPRYGVQYDNVFPDEQGWG